MVSVHVMASHGITHNPIKFHDLHDVYMMVMVVTMYLSGGSTVDVTVMQQPLSNTRAI